MLRINDTIAIPLSEITISQTRSSGPGGQNVNKVANGVHLRFNISASSLPESCKHRLLARSDRRISSDGTIVIKAQSFRSTEKNREDALQRLQMLIGAALRRDKKRVPTSPGKAARQKRLAGKLHRGRQKNLRRKIDTTE
jgi:ribosome-associated protein